MRHLQTRHLWLQSRVALGHLNLDVVAGERSRQTRIFGKLSAVTAVSPFAAAAEMVENEPSPLN